MSKKNKKKDEAVAEFYGETSTNVKEEKQERTPSQKVYDLLMSNVNDPELQNRYNSMEKNVKSWKETYNAYVLQYRDAISRKTKITEILLEGARLGIVNPEAMKLDQQVDEEITRLVSLLEEAKHNFENDERLMAKYRELTENKLFHFWEIMFMFDKDVMPYLTFKAGFANKIF